MPRTPVLSAAQEKVLRARVRAGADLPALMAFAAEKQWPGGRTVLAQIVKSERNSPTGPALEVQTPLVADLMGKLTSLEVEIASLKGRLDGMVSLPAIKLSAAANGAVECARQILANPDVEPRAKAAVMAQLPDLIEAARKALETEQISGDDDLGI